MNYLRTNDSLNELEIIASQTKPDVESRNLLGNWLDCPGDKAGFSLASIILVNYFPNYI